MNEISNLLIASGLAPELIDVIIGTGDAKMTFNSVNASYICEQGAVHKDYLFHLFDLFKDYVKADAPTEYSRVDARTVKTHISYYFATLSLPLFHTFAEMFYVRVEGTRNVIKVIPSNIGLLLTPRALAYWIMDDGTKTNRGGVTLCTDSFTLQEVMLLKGVLEDKYNFTCTLHRKKADSARIYISGRCLDQLSNIVKPYMHESFMYKITR